MRIANLHTRKSRQQTLGIAYAHLLVGNGEFVHLRLTVVALDGQVAALVEQRQGCGHGLHRNVEGICWLLYVFQAGNVRSEMFHLLDEVGWRGRSKPTAGQLTVVESVE